jgi:hypothetical protein
VTPRRAAYAALAAVGLVVTWYFNWKFMADGDCRGIVEFVRAGYANHASTSLANDLLVGVAAFWIWSFAESRRLAIGHWWIWPLLTLGVAFAVAYPLFLFVREGRIETRTEPEGRPE